MIFSFSLQIQQQQQQQVKPQASNPFQLYQQSQDSGRQLYKVYSKVIDPSTLPSFNKGSGRKLLKRATPFPQGASQQVKKNIVNNMVRAGQNADQYWDQYNRDLNRLMLNKYVRQYKAQQRVNSVFQKARDDALRFRFNKLVKAVPKKSYSRVKPIVNNIYRLQEKNYTDIFNNQYKLNKQASRWSSISGVKSRQDRRQQKKLQKQKMFRDNVYKRDFGYDQNQYKSYNYSKAVKSVVPDMQNALYFKIQQAKQSIRTAAPPLPPWEPPEPDEEFMPFKKPVATYRTHYIPAFPGGGAPPRGPPGPSGVQGVKKPSVKFNFTVDHKRHTDAGLKFANRGRQLGRGGRSYFYPLRRLRRKYHDLY